MSQDSATIINVARRAKVAVATASKVMNDDPTVRSYLRKRVLAAAAALKYQPDLIARGMKAGGLSIITCAVTDIDNPFFSTLTNHIHHNLLVSGYHMVFAQYGRELEAVTHGFRAAGCIMIMSNPDDVNAIATAVPVVSIIGQDVELQSAPNISVDMASAYRQMTELIITMGRKCFTWYGPPIADPKNRLDNFGIVERTLAHHGVAVMVTPSQLQNDPRAFAAAVSTRRHVVDCVFCHDDLEAAKLIVALEGSGIMCPEAILVVGCNGTFQIDGMATLSIDIPILARGAVDLLLMQLAGKVAPKNTAHSVHLHLPAIAKLRPENSLL